MKKLLCIFLTVAMLALLAGCGQKTLHCDKCGGEVKVSQSSNMEEDWAVYCSECAKTLPSQ